MARAGVLTLLAHNSTPIYCKHIVNKKLTWYLAYGNQGLTNPTRVYITMAWYVNSKRGYSVLVNDLKYGLDKSYGTRSISGFTDSVVYKFKYKDRTVYVTFRRERHKNVTIHISGHNGMIHLATMHIHNINIGMINTDYRQIDAIMDPIMQKIIDHKVEESVIAMIQTFGGI